MSNQRFDILLTGFPNGPQNAPSERIAIQQVFRVDASVAAQILGALPKVVRRGATRIEVRKFANAFKHIGGAVEIRDAQSGAVVPLAAVVDASVAVGGSTVQVDDGGGRGTPPSATLAEQRAGILAVARSAPSSTDRPASGAHAARSSAPASIAPNERPPARAPASNPTHYGRPSLSASDVKTLEASANRLRRAESGGRPAVGVDDVDDAVEARVSALVGMPMGDINFDSDDSNDKHDNEEYDGNQATQAGNLATDTGDFSPKHARRLQTVITPGRKPEPTPLDPPARPSAFAAPSPATAASSASVRSSEDETDNTVDRPVPEEVKQTTGEIPPGSRPPAEHLFDQFLGGAQSPSSKPAPADQQAGWAAGPVAQTLERNAKLSMVGRMAANAAVRAGATRPDIDTGEGDFPKLSDADLSGGDLDRLPRPSGANEPLFGAATDFSNDDSQLSPSISDDDLFGMNGPNAINKAPRELPDLKKSMMQRAEDVRASASAPSDATVPNVNEVQRDGPIDGFQAPPQIRVKPKAPGLDLAGPGLELDYSHKAPSTIPGVYRGSGSGRSGYDGSPQAGPAYGAASSTTAGGFDFGSAGDGLPNAAENQSTGGYMPPVYIPPAEHADDGNDDFWTTVPECLALPLRGEGRKWITMTVLATIAAVLMQFGAVFMGILGLLVALVVWAAVLALCARFFQACAAGTISQSREPNTMPSIGEVNTELIGPGLSLAFFAVVATGLPMLIWGNHLSNTGGTFGGSAVTYLLLAAPVVYWPMGLTMCADSGSTLAIWNIPRGVMGIMHAPLKYLFVVAIGLITYMLPPLIGGLVASTGNIILIVLGIALACVPMIYSHGVMGALMGKLIRNTPEVVGR